MILLPSEQGVNRNADSHYMSPTYNPFDPQQSPAETTGSLKAFAASGASDPLDHDLNRTKAEQVTQPYPEVPPSPLSSTTVAINNTNVDIRPNSTLYNDAYADPYYASHRSAFPADDDDNPLLYNASAPKKGMEEMEVEDGLYADAAARNREGFPAGIQKNSFTRRLFGNDGGSYPLQQRIENKKRGIGRQRYPFVVWALTIAMISVFIYEIVLNKQQQGSPLSFKPVVNYMLGPSQSALIFSGARFPPCMKNVSAVPVTLSLPCMNDTANPPDRLCPISELCGFGGIPPGKTPNQWFRFITPIFLHAGIIHIFLNMLAQMIISAQMEREMGSGGFLLVYFAAGIFGNVMGGNFALVGLPSVGASGAIFGTVAVTWVDLFAHWRYHYRPVSRLVFMTIELLIGIGIGFIPYVDNFAHLGGFLMGLICATFFFPVISETKRHKAIMWAFRIAALPLAIVLFVVLIRNFYTSNPYAACKWCRYLSCIPTSANNRCQGTGITTTTTGGNSVRELLF